MPTPKLYIPSSINAQMNFILVCFWADWAVTCQVSTILLKSLTFEGFYHILMGKTNTNYSVCNQKLMKIKHGGWNKHEGWNFYEKTGMYITAINEEWRVEKNLRNQ